MADKSLSMMVGYNELQKKFLRYVISTVEHDELQSCVQAMPIAVPIRQVVHKISEKRKEPVGLVQRHVLRTLFVMKGAGPGELDDVIGIGADRVERVLMRIAQHNPEVKKIANDTYRISAEGLASLEQKGYESIVEHNRLFTVNGITGDLLPVEFWGNHEACEMFRVQGSGFALRKGNKVKIPWALPSNPNRTGITSLDALLDDGDLSKRKALGVPDAAVGRASSSPTSVTSDSWVLAFLLVLADGTVRCYSAGNPPESLDLPGGTGRDYIGLMLPYLFEELVLDNIVDDDRIHCEKTKDPGIITITVDDPKVTLSHMAYSDITDVSPLVQPSKLTIPIVWGELWLPRANWAYFRLIPGDKDTAARVCVLRGIKRLQNYLASVDTARIDLCNLDIPFWWQSYQEEFFASISELLSPDLVPFSELRAQILGEGEDGAPPVPDTEFLERFKRCLSKSKKRVVGVGFKGGISSHLVVNGMDGMDITDAILVMLQKAKHSVGLMSPMCEDGRIVSVLNSKAKKDRRLITEIRERNKNHGPEYRVRKWQSLDREGGGGLGHIRNLRSLVQNGTLCRGTRAYPHAKLVLADEKAVLISSANLSPNSLGGGDGYSHEAGLYIEDRMTVAGFSKLFNALWEVSPIRQHMISGDVSITEETAVPVNPDFLRQEVEGGLVLCANLPPSHAFLTETVTRCIEDAQKEVILVALSIYDTSDIPKLHFAIKDALRRGVRIRCIVREDHGFGDKWPDKSTLELKDEGLELTTRIGLHAKGLLVDDTFCGIFSANMNPYSLDPTLPTAHMEIGLFGPADNSVMQPYADFLRDLSK